MSLLRELLLSPPDGNRRHARAGLTRLRFFLDDRVSALCWFLALRAATTSQGLTACLRLIGEKRHHNFVRKIRRANLGTRN